jgi:hypothetical protein
VLAETSVEKAMCHLTNQSLTTQNLKTPNIQTSKHTALQALREWSQSGSNR